jgi:hypothetical protein
LKVEFSPLGLAVPLIEMPCASGSFIHAGGDQGHMKTRGGARPPARAAAAAARTRASTPFLLSRESASSKHASAGSGEFSPSQPSSRL